ncbi:MAG: hypothetical protein O3C51_16230 [Planctomycetota bacterium]|nr:hypothetical protein [Planctomycetota bacterium]
MSSTTEQPPGFFERLSDRLSPILVRELQQAVAARSFAVTLGVASLAVMMMAAAFTWSDPTWRTGELGRDAFAMCVVCLAPIAVVVVPLQSLTGMRQEVVGGTAEQLLLTRIRPSRVALGKVAAGTTQFAVYLGVFAPLFGLAYLLRGVSFGSILLILFFGFWTNIAATSFAVAMGSLGKRRNQQQAAQAFASIVLFSSTTMLMAASTEMVREFDRLIPDPDFWPIVISITLVFLTVSWLFIMVATSVLSHPYENRSTSFRVFAVGVLALGGLWVVFVMDAGTRSEAAAILSGILALLLAPIWLWAPCEEEGMSPRVRSYVPRRAAILAALFLPGGGRGYLFALVLAALGIALATVLPWIADGSVDSDARHAMAAWLYAPFAGGIARVLRGRLPEGKRWSVVAFTTTVIVFFLMSLIGEVLVIFRIWGGTGWSPVHVFNPFWTVVDGGAGYHAVSVVGVIGGLMAVPAVPSVYRGLGEAVVASRTRRSRAG